MTCTNEERVRGEVQHPAVFRDQIADEVEAMIRAGVIKPGEKLPPVRKLAGLWGVGVTSAHRAVMTLRDRGLVDTSTRGTTVKPQPQHRK